LKGGIFIINNHKEKLLSSDVHDVPNI